MNPDIVRTLVAKALWQVSAPLMTGITGFVVQSFFALRIYLLARNVHLACAFSTDFFITVGACYALRSRTSGGLTSTSSLINRLLRLVFENAVPPTIVAAIDLIMTRTLNSNYLLWHLLLNYALSKLYVISLLYTLNCINNYRENQALNQEHMTTSSGSGGNITLRTTKRGDLELGNVRGNGKDQVYVQTQIITHVSPSQGPSK
ncbi:hypothetical protein C8R43DRAFT_1243952 [Mycena crocata]|nr:hypothetical protein C8R43DRAFT_1243952 [Mycena crocata]